MRFFALSATLVLLVGVTAMPGPLRAQDLGQSGSSSGGGGGSSSSSGGGSGGGGSVTASPGSGMASGTSTNVVPVPSHPSSESDIPDTTQQGQTAAARGPSARSSSRNGGSSTSSSKNSSGTQPQGPGISTLLGSEGDEDEPKYDENGDPYLNDYHQIPDLNMELWFRHDAVLSPTQVYLHISDSGMLTKCFRFSKIPSTVSYQDASGILKIELSKIDVDYRDQMKDTSTPCHSTTDAFPAAEILLDRDELRKHNVKQIELVNDKDTTDRYDLTLTDHQVRIEPTKGSRSPSLHSANPLWTRNPLRHWFYPKGTILLYTPDASGQDVTAEVDRAARARGLVPLSDLWPEFKSPLRTGSYQFYVDKNDRILKGVTNGQVVTVGSISIDKPVYGLQSDEVEKKELPIYGRAPGSTE